MTFTQLSALFLLLLRRLVPSQLPAGLHEPTWPEPRGLGLSPPPGHGEALPPLQTRQTSSRFSGVARRRARAGHSPTLHHLPRRWKFPPDASLHPLQTRGLLLNLLVLLRLRRRGLLPWAADSSTSSADGRERGGGRESGHRGEKQERESEEEKEDTESQCEGQRHGQKLHIVLREEDGDVSRSSRFSLSFRK